MFTIKGCLEIYLHGVKPFNDKDFGGQYGLRRVKKAGHMVVDGLLNGLAFFDSLHLLIHKIKVVGPWVERRHSLLLPARAIKGMVIIQAYHSRRITYQRI